ncbi:probable G-protein coupled receptor Mth-like 11 [Drosophila innubila]|uniref:probable G-protein coupled receptor Mth-like 11 n=1 Tax=Drosophila innubila TaxID=198719 RepID=UPI00148E1F8E|nr:probable G-protein coupled receptor Mth-like 11 [Drosophila innubila]
MKCIQIYGQRQPGVDVQYCWYLEWNWLIVYYVSMCLLIGINLTLSIITARHIYVENKKNELQWNSSESQMKLTSQADFCMFFRMFAVAGVIWLLDMLEMLSFLFEINMEIMEFISEIILSSQGILLFFVTILKRDVLQSLSKRMKSKGDKPIQRSEIQE